MPHIQAITLRPATRVLRINLGRTPHGARAGVAPAAGALKASPAHSRQLNATSLGGHPHSLCDTNPPHARIPGSIRCIRRSPCLIRQPRPKRRMGR